MIFKRLKKSTPEQEQEFKDMLENEQVGAKDRFAMSLSAFLVIVLPCFLLLALFGFLMLLLFGAI